MNFKGNITEIPTYNDGLFQTFKISQTEDKFPIEVLSDVKKEIYFEELSVTDSLKFDADSRDIKLTKKIRIPQTKEISSLHVLKIGEEYHKVYNAYHFTNKNGFKQTDITLIKYDNPRLEEKNDKV